MNPLHNVQMKKLSEIFANPSGVDSLSNYMGDVPAPEWYVVLTHNRDSDLLSESNWEEALKILESEEFDDDTKIFRFGHWGCGWWEALCVREGTAAFEKGQEIHDSLEAYPVLNDEAFSEAEYEEAQRVWAKCYRTRDRIKYIREHKSQFEFATFADLLGCARGSHFSGYASELLN